MLIDAQGHIRLTDFGLSRINIDVQQKAALMNLATLSRKKASTEHIDKDGKIMHPEKKKSNPLGTPDYLAPEVLFGIGNGREVDWWAFGICMFEVMVGVPPFSDDDPESIFSNILAYSQNSLENNISWPNDEEMSPAYRQLDQKLLSPDPKNRPAVDSIKARNINVN